MRKLIGPDIAYEEISRLPWTCRSIVADRWSRGRVLLAGDAVHQHGPTGGFGMNTGMGDATNLGWKLEAMLRGWGGDALLDSYQIERRPVARRNVDEATDNMGRRFSARALRGIDDASDEGEAVRARARQQIVADKTKQFVSDGIALGYRYDPSPVICPDGTPPPEDSASVYVQTSRPGSRAPHAFLADGRSTLDRFGDGFVLLRLGRRQNVASALAEAARQRGVPLTVVDIEEPEIAGLYERRLVLVRPDGHVAWRGDSEPADPLAVIDRVRGAGG